MPMSNPHRHHEPETSAEGQVLAESASPLPLFIPRAPASTRPLSPYERFFCLIEHATPTRFVFTAQISGSTTPRQWREALDQVQVRHPLLSVCIEEGADGILRFRRAGQATIPLQVVPGDPHQSWPEYASAQLAEPFDACQAPLVRATLILGPEGAALILASHHAIADGLSMVYVLRDILDAMCGTNLEPLALPPSQEQYLGLPAFSVPSHHEAHGEAASSDIGAPLAAALHIRGLQLHEHLVRCLKARARAEGTTVHGALCAALVIAGRRKFAAWNEAPVRVLSPIDTRSILGAGENCGAYHRVTPSFLAPSATEFWSLARQVRQDIVAAKTREGLTAFLSNVDSKLNAMSKVYAAKLRAAAFQSGAVLGNLGPLPFPSEFGPLKLTAVWAPAIPPCTQDEQVIGAATVDEVLYLTHTSYTPGEGLLEEMRRALIHACSL